MAKPYQIFIGWDSREKTAFEVCRHSLLRHHKGNSVEIHPLKQEDLRKAGLYTRPADQKASTEFSLTRFLVPHLCGHKGTALFVDCDFLFTADIAEVFQALDKTKAVFVVQHDYRPKHKTKMDGVPQYLYPRKNWSSLMVFNNEHPSNRKLDLKTVNEEGPQYLHQFKWLKDDEIGKLSHTWNYLVGWYSDIPKPKAVHFTEGGPWFEKYKDCDFSSEWRAEYALMSSKIRRAI